MSKRELIDRIRMLNPTAPSRFLAQFDEADLSQYLKHLAAIVPPPRATHYAELPAAEDRRDPRQLALAF